MAETQCHPSEQFLAAFVLHLDGTQTVLTRFEHSVLPRDEMRAVALSEAMRRGLLYQPDGQWKGKRMTRAQFEARLRFGEVAA